MVRYVCAQPPGFPVLFANSSQPYATAAEQSPPPSDLLTRFEPGCDEQPAPDNEPLLVLVVRVPLARSFDGEDPQQLRR
jgi:hypothetical protein